MVTAIDDLHDLKLAHPRERRDVDARGWIGGQEHDGRSGRCVAERSGQPQDR